jgi:hypothetical protein
MYQYLFLTSLSGNLERELCAKEVWFRQYMYQYLFLTSLSGNLERELCAKEVWFRQYMYQYLFLTSLSGNLERELFWGYFKSKEIFQLLVSQNVKKFILCAHVKCLLVHNSSTIMYDLKVVDHRGYIKQQQNTCYPIRICYCDNQPTTYEKEV